jgi:hypothetical protein
MPADRRTRPSRRALASYAAAWVLTGAVTATLLILILRGCSAQELPPLRRTEISDAARDGRCVLSRVSDRRPGNPPAGGRPAGTPARSGVYDAPPSTPRLVAAQRRGVVVIHYRPPIDQDRLDQLRLIQEVVPRATIVTPNETKMPYVLAAVAWHRSIGCRTLSTAALEAVRLFRARNFGRGPDAGP